MPETKRFLSQIWSSRFFVAFVFILFTDNFLQILRNSTHLLISLKKKKKRKEILRSNETGIIEAKKNNQESSSKFVITSLTLSFERRIDPNGSRSKNSGKKRNSRVYRKNFISDNEGEGEFLFLQLSPPWFIGSLEDLDEEFPPFDRGTKENTVRDREPHASSSLRPLLSLIPSVHSQVAHLPSFDFDRGGVWGVREEKACGEEWRARHRDRNGSTPEDRLVPRGRDLTRECKEAKRRGSENKCVSSRREINARGGT